MSDFKLLVVEDDEQDMKTCKDAVERYGDEKQRKIKMVECRSADEALHELDNSFDGAIIDLKLAHQGDEGNRVINEIVDSCFRIPIAIMTGTPDNANNDFTYIGIYKKGETGYAELLDIFWGIHNSGVTRIMGGRGIIEKTLNMVFLNNFIPNKDKWVKYGASDSSRTEKALLRHTLSHLIQLLDKNGERYYPEEVYLYPYLTDGIQTGDIVKQKDSNRMFVVMNPACDLVVRDNGHFKTNRILLVDIDTHLNVFPDHSASALSNRKKKELEKAYQNNKSPFYHWLPKTKFFKGGFINFRKLHSHKIEDFHNHYTPFKILISPSFVKDITARFSSYYARQGQPDIDYKSFIPNNGS